MMSATETLSISGMGSLLGNPRERSKDEVNWFATFADAVSERVLAMSGTLNRSTYQT